MDYKTTIDFLYTKLPMFSRQGAPALKANLDNTLSLCRYLGNPQDQFKSIHIAGTNGKGSVSNMLSAIFTHNGYKTGLFTSPHLKDFRERIKINGVEVPQEFVIEFVERTTGLINDIHPSFFELTAVMAFEYFASQKVDIAIIETGLGGRLDSTNVITPLLSVITNIGLDHTEILGDTLEKISFEKAGIIKQGIPVVIGEASEITLPVFEKKAAEVMADLHSASEQFTILSESYSEAFLTLDVFNHANNLNTKFTLDLNGLYQKKNLLTVLASLEILKDHFSLDQQLVENALTQVKKIAGFHGRWEIISQNPFVILDVAHNVDGIKQLINQINHSNYDKLHLVFGIVKDKDIEQVLNLLPENALYYFTNAQIPRALSAPELQRRAAEHGLHGSFYQNVNDALLAAKKNASSNDMIIVCGSVFLIGEVEHSDPMDR